MSDVETIGEETDKRPPRRSRRGRRIMAFILVVLILLLLTVSTFLVRLVMPQGRVASDPKQAGGLTWVRSIYGWGRGQSQSLSSPGSVAIAPDGTIWTTNPGNRRVVGFNPDGSYRAMLAGSGSAVLVSPTDVGTDPSGNVYVGENTLNRVVVLTPQNRLVRVLRVQHPTCITASNDRIVVGSEAGFAILDKEGNPVKIIGSRGTGDGEFDAVNGAVIAPDGKIYVVDTYNNRLEAYDRLGNRLWTVKTGNPGNQQKIQESTTPKTRSGAGLQLPEQLAMDGNGRLVVVDAFDFSLTVFNPKNGTMIAKYGAFGGEDGKLMYPSGVAYDRTRDWFAVADTNNDRLQIFRLPDSAPGSASSAFARVLTGPMRACMFPLALLLLALIVGGLSRRKKKQPERRRPDEAEAA